MKHFYEVSTLNGPTTRLEAESLGEAATQWVKQHEIDPIHMLKHSMAPIVLAVRPEKSKYTVHYTVYAKKALTYEACIKLEPNP